MARLSASMTRNLNRQGFETLDVEAKSRCALPLRFTPAVGTTLIVIGLALRSPAWLGAMALVALSGALFADPGLELLLAERGAIVEARDQSGSSLFKILVGFGPPPLLIGAPRTGKTLLARAVAGQAEVPFSSSASAPPSC